MTQVPVPQPAFSAADFDRALILAVEVSERSWVVAAHVPGLREGSKPRRTLAPTADALLEAIDGYRRRAVVAGRSVERVLVAYEAGYSGFWLARWLARRGVEAFVIQPSSVPVDRRVRRAKSDAIDAELLLRTLLAWLRGEPRVCSMVPVPTEADEDERRSVREREELVAERVALVNRISAILATLGVQGYDPRRLDRRRLDGLRTALGDPLPPRARARIERVLDRLELVLAQLAELERRRDAVLDEAVPGAAERMIQRLVRLRGVGVQSATLLVREAFVRPFADGKALGAYAGLCPTPYGSGATEREQGIGKAGNARLRTAMVELAWIWQRYQPGSAVVAWFRGRLGGAARRTRMVMVVALARKLLVALWRFATQGVLPEGAALKSAA